MKVRFTNFYLILLVFLPILCEAQKASDDRKTEEQPPAVKGHYLGGALNFTDYSASFDGLAHLTPGLSLIYMKGILPRLDGSAKLNARISSYDKTSRLRMNRVIPELELSFHLKAFPNGKWINPFVSGGAGIGYYSQKWTIYSPLGIGTEFKLGPKVQSLIQISYRFSFDQQALDNNLFYSAGFLVNISGNKKQKTKPRQQPTVRIDSDSDGVPDSRDDCPNEKGLPRFKGCPDTDNDGIPDKKDKCPDIAGTFRYKGCPVPDKDGDGVNDEEDKCPDVPGTSKRKGCPAPDTDGDGINDDDDRCPTTKGPISNQGCPEIKAEVKKKLEFAATAIQFEAEKAEIKPESYALLDEIVKILDEYKDHEVRVDGHTDNSGKPAKNMKLSKMRAEAVRDYFVWKGTARDRIIVQWHGDSLPKVSNETLEGRIQNRRVELDLTIKPLSDSER